MNIELTGKDKAILRIALFAHYRSFILRSGSTRLNPDTRNEIKTDVLAIADKLGIVLDL